MAKTGAGGPGKRAKAVWRRLDLPRQEWRSVVESGFVLRDGGEWVFGMPILRTHDFRCH